MRGAEYGIGLSVPAVKVGSCTGRTWKCELALPPLGLSSTSKMLSALLMLLLILPQESNVLGQILLQGYEGFSFQVTTSARSLGTVPPPLSLTVFQELVAWFD